MTDTLKKMTEKVTSLDDVTAPVKMSLGLHLSDLLFQDSRQTAPYSQATLSWEVSRLLRPLCVLFIIQFSGTVQETNHHVEVET